MAFTMGHRCGGIMAAQGGATDCSTECLLTLRTLLLWLQLNAHPARSNEWCQCPHMITFCRKASLWLKGQLMTSM
jgi:hypothetical protein